MGYVWRRLMSWLRTDRGMVHEDDVAGPRELVRPEFPGEEPAILMSWPSVLLLLVSLTGMWVGGSAAFFGFEAEQSGLAPRLDFRWSLVITFVGMGLFFAWCFRYPMRVVLAEEWDLAPQLERKRKEFTTHKAEAALSEYYGEPLRGLAFCRMLFPSGAARFVEFFSSEHLLVMVPVEYAHYGPLNIPLYRHDRARAAPLARVHLERVSQERFRAKYYWSRPRHHPEYSDAYFILHLDCEQRVYHIPLHFRKKEMPADLMEILNAAPAEVEAGTFAIQPDDALVSRWHEEPYAGA